MMITLIWRDGGSTTGGTWDEVEEAVRAEQWTTYTTRIAFRRDLRHRCKVWTGVRPSLLHASSEDFLRALEASGLCRVDTETES